MFNLFMLIFIPSLLEISVFQEGASTHELFISTLAMAFSIPAGFAIASKFKLEEAPYSSLGMIFVLAAIILSSFVLTNYIQKEMYIGDDSETLSYIQQEVDSDGAIVIENTLWLRPGYILSLPPETIHFWPNDPIIEVILDTEPDEIIVTNLSTNDDYFRQNMQIHGYCQKTIQQNISIPYGTDFNSTISWKKC